MTQDAGFFKLPAELRLQIYGLALGGRLLHLGKVPHPLNKGPAGAQATMIRNYVCRRQDDPDSWFHVCTQSEDGWACAKAGGHLLGLLLACRQTYTETAGLLYEANIFDLHDGSDLLAVMNVMQPWQLASIRSLKVAIILEDLPIQNFNVRRHYNRVWESIVKLQGLRELRVWVYFREPICTQSCWLENKNVILKPIELMPKYSRFNVYLPGPCSWNGADFFVGNACVPGLQRIRLAC